MKTKTLLIAAVMFFGLTAAAFAQATFTVGSIPVTAVVNTGQVELTGDITFNQNSGISNLGTITVSYPVPITVGMSATNGVVGSGVRISTASGYVVAPGPNGNPVTDVTKVGILSVSNGATTGLGQVVVQVPANQAANASFTLTGVRVAVAGTTLTSLSATISTTNNAITAGQTNVIVINAISPGIASIKTTTAGSILATTGGSVTSPVITIKEGFLNAWGQTGNATAAGLRITLSAAPPAGVQIEFPPTAITDGNGTPTFTTMNSDGTLYSAAVPFTSTSTSLAVYYKVTSDTDPTKQETLTIPVGLAFTGTSSNLPLPVVTITYVVSMAPIGTAFDSNNAVIATAALIPRYAALDTSSATLFSVTGTTTTLLIPFAQTVTADNYNTGIAIANTTMDPGKTVTGFNAPVAQSGAVTFYFFPMMNAAGTLPTSFTYTTTAGSPGVGLDPTGKVASGSTYAVLLSALLSAAGAPADFAGYMVIVTNFTNAHCLYNISNYAGFSQGSHALVISGTRDTGPENLNN